MRVSITGANGLFGNGLVRMIRTRHEVVPLTRAEADITDCERLRAAIISARPDVIVHAAAIPDLDVCEANPELARAVNEGGTRNVAEAARACGAGLAYISTDAVFDGASTTPYTETAATDPPTVYGRTKVAGEEIAAALPKFWIFRVSVLFGPGKENFISKGLRRLARGEEYVVAGDQMGSALYTLDGAAKIMEVVATPHYGLYHLSNSGACNRYELALEAARLAGLDASRVVGKPSAEMGRRAPRLKYSVMEMEALRDVGIAAPRPWQDALAEYVKGFSVESFRGC